MFKPQNKIIIVDNNPDHLRDLSKPFHDNGVGCKTLLYDPNYEEPLTGIRVAFFDINLNDLSNPEEKKPQIYSVLIDALRLYISRNNGPFALIFWTSNKGLIEGFKNYVFERNEDIPRPLILSHIDKDQFIGTGNIEAKLQDILSDKIIELLFDFERQAMIAASETVNQIYSIIPTDDKWGFNEAFTTNFDNIFSKIASSALGFDHAKHNPDGAVYEAILPMLQFYFSKASVDSTLWRGVLKALGTAKSNSEIPRINGFRESLLNTIFHVEYSSDIPAIMRGVVLEYHHSPQLSRPGNYETRLYREDEELFSKFMRFKEPEIGISEFISKCKWIAIEISSACDFSQDKPRNNKYVLALLTPVIDANKIVTAEAVFYKDLPTIIYRNEDCRIWINFNFAFSDFETNKNLDAPMFLLKKEIMDLIGNRYANHISRIGITSF